MAEPKFTSSLLNQKHASTYGPAWIVLCLALAVHVTDEALTDFLSVYNATIVALRHRLPFLPLPTFTFRVWLTGLILAVIALLVLSLFAFRDATWMKAMAYGFAFLMMANGLQHLVGSIYMGRLMPGVYSSPLLLICSIYLLRRVRNRKDAESRVELV
jgi:hypothetical protein